MADIQTQQQAEAVATALRSGRISGDEDVQRALGLLEEFNALKERRQEFLTTQVDYTPTDPDRAITAISPEFDPAPTSFFGLQLGDPEEAKREARKARAKWEEQTGYANLRAAAAKGVDVESGISPSLRAKAGLLNFKPNTAEAVLSELVRLDLEGDVPTGVPVVGQIDGVPVALQRRGDGQFKYTAIDGVGLDLGDLGEWAAELPAIGVEIAGGVTGAVIGGAAGSVVPGVGTAAGAMAGSAIGSGVAGYMSLDARVWLAKKAGVPEELIDDVVTDGDRFANAVLASLGDVATAAVIGGTRFARNLKGGKVLEPEDVARVWDDATKTLEQAAEFKTATGKELPLTLGQVTGDTDLMVAERVAATRARQQTAAEMTADSINRDRAVQDALRDLTNQRVRTPRDSLRSIEEVTEDVQSGIAGQSRQAQLAAEQADEALELHTRVMDETRSPETFTRVRDNVYEAAEEGRAAERMAWDNYRREVSWVQGEGSNVQMHSPLNDSPIQRTILAMDEDAQSALLQSTRDAQRKFLADAGMPVVEEGGESAAVSGLMKEWLDPRELHFTLSDLKRRIRQAERSADPDGFRVSDMKRLAGAIEETIQTAPMRYRRAGRTVNAEKAARVRESFNHANDLTVRVHSLYDNANMRELLKVNPRTKELQMPQGMVYDRLFKPNDPRFLNDALEAIGDNPQTKAALADELVKKHRNATRTDFDGTKHRDFVDAHYDHLRALGLDPDNMRGARALAEQASLARRQADTLAKRLAAQFGDRLSQETTNPINIHDELMRVGPTKARNVLRVLDEMNPALADEVRDHSLVQIRRTLASDGDTQINFNQLWDMVDNNRSTLAALHGADYVKSLDMLKRTQQILERDRLARPVPGQQGQPWWLDVSRSMLGPLSKKQRFISAVQRTNRRFAARGARQVISTPEDLNQFIALRNRTIRDVLRDQTLSDAVRGLAFMGGETDLTEAALQNAADLGGLEQEEPAGSSIVPGRVGPAEAVGAGRGLSPEQQLSKPLDKPSVRRLIRHEGFRGTEYIDSTGHRTIGFGRNVEANPITESEYRRMGTTPEEVAQRGIDEQQAMVLLANDYARAVKDAVKMPGWKKLNDARKDVLINMAFNLGGPKLRKFTEMQKGLARGDYDYAAAEMLDSLWADQVGERAIELSEIMRTGVDPGEARDS